jgi:DNA-binding IclR family transcriptional regulator
LPANRVEAVERALTILNQFLDAPGGLSLKQIAERTGYYKSTILRLCGSLEVYGYLRRDTEGRFHLGETPARLAAHQAESLNLEPFIRPALHALVKETDETASFYVADGAERICRYRENSRRAIRHHIDEGVRLPITQGASGMVLRAFATRREGDPDLDRVAGDGFFYSVGERDPDLASVAAPVRQSDGTLLGALTLSGLRTRFGSDRREQLTRAVCQRARSLGRTIDQTLRRKP